jgi:hypothetical protein
MSRKCRVRPTAAAQLEALGVLDFAAEEGGGHFVRLVADDQVPAAIRELELLLQVFVAGELVEAGDHQVVLLEPVAGTRGLELVVGEDLERQLEAAVELVLPLLGETAGADDQAALGDRRGHQLLDEQPGHDGLAGAGIIGQEEAQRLARQHGLVDGGDLVRQRLDVGGVHRHHGVEQVGEADALRFGNQAEECAITVETPGSPDLHDFEPWFVVAIEELIGDFPGRRLVSQLQRLGAKPLDADDGNLRFESTDRFLLV